MTRLNILNPIHLARAISSSIISIIIIIIMAELDILNPIIHLARAISSRFESRAARVVDSTITSKSKIMSTKHFEIQSSLDWMIECNIIGFYFELHLRLSASDSLLTGGDASPDVLLRLSTNH